MGDSPGCKDGDGAFDQVSNPVGFGTALVIALGELASRTGTAGTSGTPPTGGQGGAGGHVGA
jgi:hypothetical protein